MCPENVCFQHAGQTHLQASLLGGKTCTGDTRVCCMHKLITKPVLRAPHTDLNKHHLQKIPGTHTKTHTHTLAHIALHTHTHTVQNTCTHLRSSEVSTWVSSTAYTNKPRTYTYACRTPTHTCAAQGSLLQESPAQHTLHKTIPEHRT